LICGERGYVGTLARNYGGNDTDLKVITILGSKREITAQELAASD